MKRSSFQPHPSGWGVFPKWRTHSAGRVDTCVDTFFLRPRTSLQQPEIHLDVRENRHGLALFGSRLKLPLAHRLNRFFVEAKT
jgi:hypothetical protein